MWPGFGEDMTMIRRYADASLSMNDMEMAGGGNHPWQWKWYRLHPRIATGLGVSCLGTIGHVRTLYICIDEKQGEGLRVFRNLSCL
jgi:hypothetical protein